MPTENDPTITINYLDGTWKSVLAYAKHFNIKNAGVLNVPTAEITLNNKDGYWTTGASKIPDGARMRITADVRGVVDELFDGYYLRPEGNFSRRKHDVKLRCKGLAVKLLWDTITYPYHTDDENRGCWPIIDVISSAEGFLILPDSGVDTDIDLVTDDGDILTARPIDDFNRQTLLDALRKVAEQINYDGYMYDANAGVGAIDLKLLLKAVGTVACNPSISLDHPFIFTKPVIDTEEVRNFIYPWGDVDVGSPPSMDRWTEDYDRWANLWTAGANNTVVDSADEAVSGRSIKITNAVTHDLDATLDISADPNYSYVDCSGGRYMHLEMWLFNKAHSYANLWPTIDLYDDAVTPNIIRRGRAAAMFRSYGKLPWKTWKLWVVPVGLDQTIWDTAQKGHDHKEWFYTQGSSFSWKVKKVRIWSHYDETYGDLFCDVLYFKGGLEINPFTNDAYFPVSPVYDQTSIDAYQRRVLHHEDKTVKTFEQATASAQRALAALKDPIKKFKVKKGAKTWAKPHQYLVLNLPEYEVSSEYWRILELQHDWQAKGNILRTTFSLVPQTARVSTTAIQLDELGGILGSLIR